MLTEHGLRQWHNITTMTRMKDLEDLTAAGWDLSVLGVERMRVNGTILLAALQRNYGGMDRRQG